MYGVHGFCFVALVVLIVLYTGPFKPVFITPVHIPMDSTTILFCNNYYKNILLQEDYNITASYRKSSLEIAIIISLGWPFVIEINF